MLGAKQICADCHFFVKEAHGASSLTPMVLDVSQRERGQAKGGDFSWVKEHYALACYFGVWDEGFNFDPQRRNDVIVETERRDFCFFWKYRPGMLLPAAKVLQEREARIAEARRDRRLTIWGLWIAAAALVVNLFVTVAEHLKWWPFGNP